MDVACRFGGDEFVILVVDTPAADVDHIADRIQDHLVMDPTAHPGLVLSIGGAERAPHDARTLDDLVDEADREMYQQRLLRRLREQPER